MSLAGHHAAQQKGKLGENLERKRMHATKQHTQQAYADNPKQHQHCASSSGSSQASTLMTCSWQVGSSPHVQHVAAAFSRLRLPDRFSI